MPCLLSSADVAELARKVADSRQRVGEFVDASGPAFERLNAALDEQHLPSLVATREQENRSVAAYPRSRLNWKEQ